MTYFTKGYERRLPVLDQLLREEADKKAEEYAVIINDGAKRKLPRCFRHQVLVKRA